MDTGTLGNKTVVLCSGYDLTAYLQGLQAGATVDQLEATTFADQSRKRYKNGYSDASFHVDGLWDTNQTSTFAGDALDEVLAAALADGLDSVWTVLPFGDTFGEYGYAYEGARAKSDVTDAPGQLVKASIDVQPKNKDRVVVLHPQQSEAATGNGNGLDDGVVGQTLNGGVGILHVTDLSVVGGDTLTAKIQHSADGTTWSDLIVFTAVTAEHKFQRVELASNAAVYEHVRATWTLSAGASATFHVAFARR